MLIYLLGLFKISRFHFLSQKIQNYHKSIEIDSITETLEENQETRMRHYYDRSRHRWAKRETFMKTFGTWGIQSKDQCEWIR